MLRCNIECCIAQGSAYFNRIREEQPIQPPMGSGQRSLTMINNLIAYAQTRIEKRREYNRLANEIASLTSRDLADIRADRTEMLRHAYNKIYG